MGIATRRGIVSRRRALVAAAFGVTLVLQGCATKKDIRTLQESMVQMQMHQDSAIQALQRQNRLMLDTLRSSMSLTLDTRGQTAHRFEELNNMIESSKQLNGQILDVSRQLLAGMNSLEAKLEAMKLQAAAPPPTQPPPGISGGMSAEQTYQQGVQKMSDGQYGSARTYFGAIITSAHDSPVAPDAKFQIGETFALEDNLPRAYEAFEQVASEWPNAPRAAEALYRAGTIARDARDNTNAKKFFNKVVQLYSKTQFAPLARKELGKLPK